MLASKQLTATAIATATAAQEGSSALTAHLVHVSRPTDCRPAGLPAARGEQTTSCHNGFEPTT